MEKAVFLKSGQLRQIRVDLKGENKDGCFNEREELNPELAKRGIICKIRIP